MAKVPSFPGLSGDAGAEDKQLLLPDAWRGAILGTPLSHEALTSAGSGHAW